MFSEEGIISLKDGIEACERILAHSVVQDSEYQESLFHKARQLQQAGHLNAAKNAYLALLTLPPDNKMHKLAKKALNIHTPF